MTNQFHIITDHQQHESPFDGRVDGTSVCFSVPGALSSGELDAVGQHRQRMILDITKRLEESQKKTGSISSSNSKSIALAAKQIEARLFVTASSMEEYRDPATLRDRFHQMVSYMLERRLQKAEAAAAKSASPAHRLKVLSSSVNPEVAREVVFLVKQIEFLQVGKPGQRERSLGTRDVATATKRVISPSFHLVGQQTVPKPVRDLFFQASIIRAFYFTPLERLKDIPWRRLIASTRSEIQEYHEWIAESKAD